MNTLGMSLTGIFMSTGRVEDAVAVHVSFSLMRVGKDCIVPDSYQAQLCKDAEGADKC